VRYVVVLLAGVLLGFLLGRASREERGARGGRGAELPRAVPAPHPQAAPAPSASAPDAPAPESPATAPPPVDDGTGWLEIDWTGPQVWREVRLLGRDLRGDWQGIDLPAEEGLVRKELAAGRYRFEARAQEDLSPREWQVDIRAGGVTRLTPGAEAPQPIPEGLARIDFAVLDLEGRPVPRARLVVTGRGPEGETTTSELANREGRGRLHLRPGHYRLAAGASRREVDLEAGQAVDLVFPATGLGEVRLNLRQVNGHPLLAPADRSMADEDLYFMTAGTFFHVRPGLYDLMAYVGSRKAPLVLGQVRAVAGQSVTWEDTVPRGELDIVLHYAAGQGDRLGTWPVEVTPLEGEGEPFLTGIRQWGGRDGPEADEEWSLCRVTHLSAGRYRVCFVGEGWLPAEAEAYVAGGGDRPRIDLHLQRR